MRCDAVQGGEVQCSPVRRSVVQYSAVSRSGMKWSMYYNIKTLINLILGFICTESGRPCVF